MRGSVIVQHEVYDIELRRNEDDLESGVPQRLRRVRPEEVEVASNVDS